ncbi:hypothetical protein BT63DRAFT_477824 [Microthyrium microscopicum]|uniref:Uncharacterized protein n=1 Tax=Microthyrium microscopicum TaxID=703497 RepID=A0A6A6UGJ9_9PEZI|nr:hypothetical protein BT63DRAFT_477824 [Microthyrium microscopicum]
MFAIQADQENFIHGQQTAAASKPLNQTVRGLTAKTPGNKAPKTPFKVPLNDENAKNGPGKSGLKTIGGKAKATFDKSAFVTPAGPKNRPALGAKTTNAKARPFLTPAPPKAADPSPSKGSPRLHRPKIKVLQSEPVDAEDDIPDIEHMPPRSKDLRDIPSEDTFGPDKRFPHLEPGNFSRGWAETYFSRDEATAAREEAEARAAIKRDIEADCDKAMNAAFASIDDGLADELGMPKKAITKKAAPATMSSRRAATALSSAPTTKRTVPASTKARVPTALNVRKGRQTPVVERAGATKALSKSTLGYAQGRAISQKVRKPATAIFRDTEPRAKRSMSAVSRTASDEEFDTQARDVVAQLRMQSLSLVDDDSEDEELLGRARLIGDEEDELSDFQFPHPVG